MDGLGVVSRRGSSEQLSEQLRRGTVLASRIRDKYFGGRGGAGSPVQVGIHMYAPARLSLRRCARVSVVCIHILLLDSVQDLDDYLTDAVNRRQSSAAAEHPWGSVAPVSRDPD